MITTIETYNKFIIELFNKIDHKDKRIYNKIHYYNENYIKYKEIHINNIIITMYDIDTIYEYSTTGILYFDNLVYILDGNKYVCGITI